MPEGHGQLRYGDPDDLETDDDDDAYERFKRETCRDCDYYFDTRSDSEVDDITDEHGNPASFVEYRSLCPCRRSGIAYVDWPCEDGHEDPIFNKSPTQGTEGPMPPMVYAVDLHAGGDYMGCVKFDAAYAQVLDAERWQVGGVFRTMNTYSNHRVCWGNDNSDPSSLPEIVEQYINTPANDDLLKVHEYAANLSSLNADVANKPITGLVIPAGCDAALLVCAAHQPAAYLLLRASGYPAEEGVIATGLRKHSLEHDGQQLEGYCTTAVDGHCWFVIQHPDAIEDTDRQGQALLLSQIPDPFPPCSSPAPSSSALAALAAS